MKNYNKQKFKKQDSWRNFYRQNHNSFSKNTQNFDAAKTSAEPARQVENAAKKKATECIKLPNSQAFWAILNFAILALRIFKNSQSQHPRPLESFQKSGFTITANFDNSTPAKITPQTSGLQKIYKEIGGNEKADNGAVNPPQTMPERAFKSLTFVNRTDKVDTRIELPFDALATAAKARLGAFLNAFIFTFWQSYKKNPRGQYEINFADAVEIGAFTDKKAAAKAFKAFFALFEKTNIQISTIQNGHADKVIGRLFAACQAQKRLGGYALTFNAPIAEAILQSFNDFDFSFFKLTAAQKAAMLAIARQDRLGHKAIAPTEVLNSLNFDRDFEKNRHKARTLGKLIAYLEKFKKVNRVESVAKSTAETTATAAQILASAKILVKNYAIILADKAVDLTARAKKIGDRIKTATSKIHGKFASVLKSEGTPNAPPANNALTVENMKLSASGGCYA